MRQPCGLQEKCDGAETAQGPGTGQVPGQAGSDTLHKQVVEWSVEGR